MKELKSYTYHILDFVDIDNFMNENNLKEKDIVKVKNTSGSFITIYYYEKTKKIQ